MTATALNVWLIESSGPLVRIDKHNLPDLDDVMLEVLMHPDVHDELVYEWEPVSTSWGSSDDVPTYMPGYSRGGEPRVGYFRKNPCACGDGHTFDLGEVPMDDDGRPVGKAARGAFLGVYFA